MKGYKLWIVKAMFDLKFIGVNGIFPSKNKKNTFYIYIYNIILMSNLYDQTCIQAAVFHESQI